MLPSNEDTSSTSSYKTDTLRNVEAHCLGTIYRSRQQQAIYDVSGTTIGYSTIAPPVYIQDKIFQLREASSYSLTQRYELLELAGKIYQEEILADLDPKTYAMLVSRVTGLPESIITDSLFSISSALQHMREILQAATPVGAVWDYRESAANTGCSLFSRRADVVAIITSGNGPGVHGLWPQAIAMGYRTIVKPSSREPFTAQRLITALELAGLGNYVALVPTNHTGTDTLVTQSDLAIIYGGADTVTRYKDNPCVLVQGPGRSKIVVGKDVCHQQAVDSAAHSILSLGGAACVSASAVLVEDDYVGFADKLKRTLEIRFQHQSKILGRQQEAELYRKILESDDIPWHYEQHPQGCILKPHVTLATNAADPKVQRELPFPCVTVAPFSPKEGYKALSGSLVVTVLSHQQDLIDKILADASIANVYIGYIPTTWMDYRVPHDGYLADFLMCNRGVRVENEWLMDEGLSRCT